MRQLSWANARSTTQRFGMRHRAALSQVRAASWWRLPAPACVLLSCSQWHRSATVCKAEAVQLPGLPTLAVVRTATCCGAATSSKNRTPVLSLLLHRHMRTHCLVRSSVCAGLTLQPLSLCSLPRHRSGVDQGSGSRCWGAALPVLPSPRGAPLQLCGSACHLIDHDTVAPNLPGQSTAALLGCTVACSVAKGCWCNIKPDLGEK